MKRDLSDILEMAQAMATDVPGVRVETAEWTEAHDPHAGTMGKRHQITITAVGWGATMHERRRHWKIDVTGAYNDDPAMRTAQSDGAFVHTIRTMLRYILEEHALIAQGAAKFGIPVPMPIPSRVGARDIENIHVARATLDTMIAKLGAAGTVDALAGALAELFATQVGSENQLLANAVALATFEDGIPEVAPVVRVSDVNDACLIGSHLRMSGSLPATIMAAATGRELGAVVATGIAVLDATPILMVTTTGWNEMTIELDTPKVRIGDHQLLAGALAADPHRQTAQL